MMNLYSLLNENTLIQNISHIDEANLKSRLSLRYGKSEKVMAFVAVDMITTVAATFSSVQAWTLIL